VKKENAPRKDKSGIVRILAVDDEQSTLELFEEVLCGDRSALDGGELARLEARLFERGPTVASGPCFDVVLCRQGEQAVERVGAAIEAGDHFGVAFIDVRMPPGRDGVWTAEMIRAIDPDVEIVMVTAYSDLEPREIAGRVPPVEKLLYIQKPFHPQEIYQFAHSLGSKWLVEREFSTLRRELEARVEQRTKALAKANEQLRVEIEERGRAEEERKKLELTLQQAHKMKAIGTLAGGIAHDFNNLLMGIQGRVSLMELGTDPAHPHLEHLQSIEKIVSRGADLTKQLLGFARGGKYEVMATDLNELIKTSTDLFGHTRKEIFVRREFAPDLWTVEVDRSQIEQVLLNIFLNAWQAMPEGGELYLRTANVVIDEGYVKPFTVEPGRYVKVSITDTGVGMEEEVRRRCFEPFFTTRGTGEGTGLGLASAYGITKNHKGIINVYSEVGEGTTVNLYFPASAKEVEASKVDQGRMVKGHGTILLVDDEEMIIEVGAGILKALGYELLLARCGREAVEVYARNREKVRLVILDMIMPVDGGEDTYERLREIEPEVKVLLSSGYSLNGRASRIMDRGCSGFIQKPYTLNELSQKIKEILES
jgi:signal transduction histidine kinase